MADPMPTTKAVGMDLGTTNSCVAYKNGSVIEVVKNRYGNYIMPSVVYFGSSFKEVGEEAQKMRENQPLNTVFHIKRFMGRMANDPEIMKYFPYPFDVLKGNDGEAIIRVTPFDDNGPCESREYSPEQISAYILRYLKALARNKIGPQVADVVITVPASFNDAQKQATRVAGRMAGLNVLRLLAEPTAAALAYGIGMESKNARVVLVYDLGGGTFDVSIVRCQGLEGDVLSTSGLAHLGGDDFDQLIYQYATNEFIGKGINISGNDFPLIRSCEEAKQVLSELDTTTIPYFVNGIRHECEITRAIFEELCMHLFKDTIRCVENAITESGLAKEAIDDVVLVGGSSKIPKIRQMLREFFGNKDLKLNIPPEHAVAHGAAILAESLSEAARGAVKIKDVLPYSLGVDITYGRFSILLKSNTTYPVSHTACYENARENCTELKFQIFEGEKALHKENNRLGVCTIPIPKRKVGENKILVTFSVDEDGILSVHLRDKDTAVERGKKVETTRYTEEQVLNMIKDMRFEEEQEQIQRAKFLARSAFADSMAKVRKITGKTDSTKKKTELDNLVKTEDEWINNMENPSNEELIKRASEIDEKLAAIMKK